MKRLIAIALLLLSSSVFALTCTGNQKLVEIHRIYGLNAADEKMEIYSGVATNGQLIFTEDGFSKSYREIVRQLCLTDNVYGVKLYSTSETGWDSDSRFYITVYSHEYLRGTLVNRFEAQQFLYLMDPFTPTTDWRYTNTAQSTPNWRTTEPGTWGTRVTAGNFPNITSATTTRYYVRSITNNINPGLLEVMVYTRFGFVAYMGNTEILRHFLPATVQADTNPTNVDASPSWKKVVLSGSFFVVGKSTLILAFEIHSGTFATDEKDEFKVITRFIIDTPCPRLFDVAITSVPEPMSASSYDAILDRSVNTVFAVNSNRVNITFKFHNYRKELIHQYVIRSSSSRPGSDPQSWALYGAVEDLGENTQWVYMDSRVNELFLERNEAKSYSLINNMKTYNMFMLSIEELSDDSSTLQIGYISFDALGTNVYNINLSYPSGMHRYYMNIDPNVNISPVITGFSKFSTNPSLPDGININYHNGLISGIVPQDSAESSRTYSVGATAIGSTTPTSTSVQLALAKCSRTDSIKLLLRYVNRPGNFRDSYYLYQGIMTLIHNSFGSNSISTNEKVFCLPNSQTYRILLRTTSKDIWTQGTFLELEIFYHISKSIKLGRLRLNGSTREQYSFPTEFVLPHTAVNEWYVFSSTTDAEPPTDWSSNQSMTSSGWSSFDTTSFEPAAAVNRNVWFLRRIVSITAIDNAVSSYELRFFCRAGVVVYINGVEKYRLNVEDGPITSESMITGGSSLSYWHILTGLKGDFHTGTNLISFAVVNTLSSLPIDFNVVLLLSTVSKIISRSFDVTITSNYERAGFPPSNLADLQDETMSVIDRATSTSSGYWDIHFKNERRELINMYCFVNNLDFPHHDPTAWDVYGSVDGVGDISSYDSSWVFLGNETMTSWKTRGHRACFYLLTNDKAFNVYRFVMRENSYPLPSNAFALSEIELFTVDLNGMGTEATIGLAPKTQIAYVNAHIIPVIANNDYYRNCVVTPPLPVGVAVDPYGGVVSGSPIDVLPVTTYTISCLNYRNQEIMNTFTLDIRVCSEDEGRDFFSVVFENTLGQGKYIGYSLHNGPTTFASRSTLPNYSEHEVSLCLLANSTLVVRMTGGFGGFGIHYASLRLSDNSEIFRIAADTNSNVEVNSISPFLVVKNLASWYYLHEGEAPLDWKTNNTPTSWQRNSTALLPVPTSITQYYVLPFRLRGRSVTGELEYTIRIKAGAIIYLNGIIIGQFNMPGTSVTSDTLATTEYSMPRTFRGSYKTYDVVGDNNVLAVEVHRTANIPTSRVFQMTLMFVHEYVPRQYRGIASSSDELSEESYLNAFDNNPMTTFRSRRPCSQSHLQFDYNDGSRYYINSYLIRVDTTCGNLMPVSWVFEGSENGHDWNVLDAQINHEWNGSGTIRDESFTFSNPVTYSSYRIRFTACNNVVAPDSCPTEGIQIVDFNLYNARPNGSSACNSVDGFPMAYRNEYSYKACDGVYTGYMRRQCNNNGMFGNIQNYCRLAPPSSLSYRQTEYEFKVNANLTQTVIPTVVCAACSFYIFPELVEGLVLNDETGELTGEPLTNSNFVYTITAMNVAGETTIDITIITSDQTIHCPLDELNGWERGVAGVNATKPCPNGYQGQYKRWCNDGSPAFWGVEIDECFPTNPTITYPASSYDFVKHNQISTIVPTITGASIIQRSISPTLPSGLYFDPNSGSISGSPTVKTSAIEYTVTVRNAYSSVTTTFTITITSLWCNTDGDWGQTDSGDTFFMSCPINKEGTWSRMCSIVQPPIWIAAVDNCHYILPVLTYPKSAYQMQRGMVVNIYPTKQYYITSITYSGTLPAGINFSSSDGSISGTPSTVTDSSVITITITNPDKTNQVYLTLSVVSIKCNADGIWPVTEAGQVKHLSCDVQKEGELSRLCTLSGEVGVWETVVGSCTWIMPSVNYQQTTATFKKNIYTTFVPTVANKIDTFTITPTLPAGISLDPQTGNLYGSALGPASNIDYVIVASNADKALNVNLKIIVFLFTCPSENGFPETERDTFGYKFCAAGQVGVYSRKCIPGSGDLSHWESEVSSCKTNPSKEYPSEGKVFNRFTAVVSGLSKALFTADVYHVLTSVFSAGTETMETFLFIEKYDEGDVTISEPGMLFATRIEADAATGSAKSEKISSFFTSNECTTKLRASKLAVLANAKCGLSGGVTIVKPAGNTALTVLMVVVIVFLFFFIVLAAYYFYVRSKSKDTKDNHKALQSGRIGTRGKPNDADIERAPKNQNRSYDDREEEPIPKKSSAKPKPKSKFVDEDDDEDDYKPSKPMRRK